MVDHLDAVVPEERIAEARGVRAGYRCLALLHRAEAAVPRGTITIFAAIFTGAHCSWCKQSTQCNRHDQRRSGDGHCFQRGGGHLNLLSPGVRYVLFDPRAQRARVKACKSPQIIRKEGEPAQGEADLHRRAGARPSRQSVSTSKVSAATVVSRSLEGHQRISQAAIAVPALESFACSSHRPWQNSISCLNAKQPLPRLGTALKRLAQRVIGSR